jgi:hypothetical protein
MSKFDSILDELKNMSLEDYERDLLCLNGIMTEEIFDNVINKIGQYSLSDDLLYSRNELHEQFVDVFHYIETFAKNSKVCVESDFPEYHIYFSYKGNNYTWRLLIGQGSFCEIYFDTEEHERIEITIDQTIKFFKRL